MGNGYSIYSDDADANANANVDIVNKINKIATEYIVQQNYSDMKRLLDKNKYDEMVDLVTIVLSKNIKTSDIEILVNHLYSTNVERNIQMEIQERQIQETHLKKCKKIALFYLKVAHLFDSIMMCISPYIMSSSNILSFDNTTQNMNMCTRRLNALIDANINLGKQNEINMKSPSCHMYADPHSLMEEEGIPELEKLYYDMYDFDSRSFAKMSEKMRREYEMDVELFYNAFQGNKQSSSDSSKQSSSDSSKQSSSDSSKQSSSDSSKQSSSNVKRFSDIKMSDIITKDYNKDCNSTDEYVYVNNRTKPYRQEKERLFKKYTDNIKTMTAFIHKSEKELLYILNNVFVKDERINAYNLHENIHLYTIDKLSDDARRIIVDFYSKCEEFYVEGVQIYEAIVQNQIKHTTIRQIETSNDLLNELRGI
jgi:hypothetical protein